MPGTYHFLVTPRSVFFATMLTVLAGACSSTSDGTSSSSTEVASSEVVSNRSESYDSEFCQQVREMDTGEIVVETPADVISLYDDLVEKSPEAIVDDMTVVRDSIIEAGDTIIIDNGNLAFPTELSENPRFATASESVGRFSQEECGV